MAKPVKVTAEDVNSGYRNCACVLCLSTGYTFMPENYTPFHEQYLCTACYKELAESINGDRVFFSEAVKRLEEIKAKNNENNQQRDSTES